MLKNFIPNDRLNNHFRVVREGKNVYILRTLYIITKDRVLKDNNQKHEKIYLLNNSKQYRSGLKLWPKPSENIKLINSIKQLISFIIKICEFKDDHGYKINIFTKDFINIENDTFLCDYQDEAIYVKIDEIKNQEPSQSIDQSYMSSTDNKTRNKLFHSSLQKNIKNGMINVGKVNASVNTSNSVIRNGNNSSNILQNIKLKRSPILDYENFSLKSVKYFPEINSSQKKYNNDSSKQSSDCSRIMSQCSILNRKKNYTTLFRLNNIDRYKSIIQPFNLKFDDSYKNFPARGKYKQIKKSASTNIFEEKKKNHFSKLIKHYERYIQNQCLPERKVEEKAQILKNFLMSKSQFTEPSLGNQVLHDHDFDMVKNEYTSFLLVLRKTAFEKLNSVVPSCTISGISDFVNRFNFSPKLEKRFPFNTCIKEFVLYSYLSSFTTKYYGELVTSFQRKEKIKKGDIINCISGIKKELERIISDATDVVDFCNNNKSCLELSISVMFFDIFVLCADYFTGSQSQISHLVIVALQLNLDSISISYECFSEYFYYFRCSEFLTNEEKYNFIKKILFLAFAKGFNSSYNKEQEDLQIEVRKVFGIDNSMIKVFEKDFSSNTKIELIKKYAKIDMIFTNMINYFTYQQ